MSSIESLHFGRIEYETGKEIHFPQALPGFEQETSFLLLEPKASKPLIFLQSVRNPEVCFTMLPIAAFDPSYELQLTPEDEQILGGAAVALAILCTNEQGAITANLLAPIAINPSARSGVQAVRWDTLYSHAQPLEAASCS